MSIFRRMRRATALGLCLLGLFFGPATVHAQGDEPAEGKGSSSPGEPWQGYAAWGFVACITLFLVCKSARRS